MLPPEVLIPLRHGNARDKAAPASGFDELIPLTHGAAALTRYAALKQDNAI